MQQLHINFTVPQGWHELSNRQLRYIFTLMKDEMFFDEIKTLCLLKWGGAKLIGRQANNNFLLRKNKWLFEVTPNTIAELLPFFKWLDNVPDYPIRMSRINGRKAIAADFQGVPFETYIVCENFFQGVLTVKNNEQRNALLADLGGILYPGISRKFLLKHDWALIAIFYWMSSLKNYLSLRYKYFFQPTGNSNTQLPNSNTLQEAMDAQIRALTKGDPTKEAEILQLDTWRALTELNAQAREYQEMQKQLNK